MDEKSALKAGIIALGLYFLAKGLSLSSPAIVFLLSDRPLEGFKVESILMYFFYPGTHFLSALVLFMVSRLFSWNSLSAGSDFESYKVLVVGIRLLGLYLVIVSLVACAAMISDAESPFNLLRSLGQFVLIFCGSFLYLKGDLLAGLVEKKPLDAT